jgi:hypothetical protein
MYDTIDTRSPLAKKATKVGTIFDTIGWVVALSGSLLVLLVLLGTMLALFGDDGLYALMIGIPAAIVVVIYTAVLWASVSLATIVAQYIASKS